MHPISFVIALVACVAAAPQGWSPNLAKFLSETGKEIEALQRNGGSLATCDLSKAQLPSAPQSLPAIPDGQQLLHVGVGRGTQNYTCASASESEKPVPQGALATIFDVSCLATDFPNLLSLFTGAALEFPNPPASAESFGPIGLPVLGHHYFSNKTTAVFDVNGCGLSSVAKEDAVDAPSFAVKGIAGRLGGAVDWLYLASIPGSAGKAKSIYRTNTAGGSSPGSCKNQPKDVTVQYAAAYWFYG